MIFVYIQDRKNIHKQLKRTWEKVVQRWKLLIAPLLVAITLHLDRRMRFGWLSKVVENVCIWLEKIKYKTSFFLKLETILRGCFNCLYYLFQCGDFKSKNNIIPSLSNLSNYCMLNKTQVFLMFLCWILRINLNQSIIKIINYNINY